MTETSLSFSGQVTLWDWGLKQLRLVWREGSLAPFKGLQCQVHTIHPTAHQTWEVSEQRRDSEMWNLLSECSGLHQGSSSHSSKCGRQGRFLASAQSQAVHKLKCSFKAQPAGGHLRTAHASGSATSSWATLVPVSSVSPGMSSLLHSILPKHNRGQGVCCGRWECSCQKRWSPALGRSADQRVLGSCRCGLSGSHL